MNASDAATVASICTLLGVVIQSILNQWGAERERKHQLEMARLKIEAEDDDDEK